MKKLIKSLEDLKQDYEVNKIKDFNTVIGYRVVFPNYGKPDLYAEFDLDGDMIDSGECSLLYKELGVQ